jgi:hypothetical protein
MFRRALAVCLLLLCLGTTLPAAAQPHGSDDPIMIRVARIIRKVVKNLLTSTLEESEISVPKP